MAYRNNDRYHRERHAATLLRAELAATNRENAQLRAVSNMRPPNDPVLLKWFGKALDLLPAAGAALIAGGLASERLHEDRGEGGAGPVATDTPTPPTLPSLQSFGSMSPGDRFLWRNFVDEYGTYLRNLRTIKDLP